MIYPMDNTIKNYEWGSTTALTKLFGHYNPDRGPQAELWMGTHPNGCSIITLEDNTKVPLSDFCELPFLFKVLCAGKALSIQVHPNKKQAEEGFQRENNLGIPLTDPKRNYKDDNHKPEIIYTLTPFKAMNGFREIDDIVANFEKFAPKFVRPLSNNRTNLHLLGFVEAIFKSEITVDVLADMLDYAKDSNEEPFKTCLELNKQYPNDIGALMPLVLNVVELEAGQAMFLDAGTPHAYISGTGLELMANSDNVLRAGLTGKHIDVEELIKCTVFEPKTDIVLKESDGYFDIPVLDFDFNIISNNTQVLVMGDEILFPFEDDCTIEYEGKEIFVPKGTSVFVSKMLTEYKVITSGKVARAF